MMRMTPIVKNILIINVVIALIQGFLNLPLNDWLSLRVIFSPEWAPWQFFTYMWLHAGMWHLFGNMFAVFIFGPMLEHVWGSKRFLTFYMICGVGAGVLYGVADFFEKLPVKQQAQEYVMNPNPEDFRIFILDHKLDVRSASMLTDFSDEYYEHPDDQTMINQSKRYVSEILSIYINGSMVGASGAVFGILMAFGMLFPNTQLMLLFPPIPVRAKYIVLFYGLYELYAEFSRAPGDNVAHLAHLGGMLIAFILIKYWARKSNRFY
ncbi:rhomboid family intramembrane serine protease [Marinoscillum sp. MHG1-6]|uniref:rhomboid family intramembrane serine protease n=1 Tax=Marinoscillum sp. MHG1-6 TaxID=2959627 RepID=UPI002157D3D1|nr:rhomboid family intramembrane serine protease [Marinoscillum sp. MHG1-6]